jgi:urease accessory protein
VFVHGWQALWAPEPRHELTRLADIVMAAQGSAERALETSAQGSAFRRIALAANGGVHLRECAAYREALSDIADNELPYALAASVFFATFDVPLGVALVSYLHGALSNLVSAAQRIVPLGHTEAQILLVQLEADVEAAQKAAIDRRHTPIEIGLGNPTFAAENAAMRHETQYTRLFRT